MDVYWLAAVLTILVEGSAVMAAYIRFVKRNVGNPWLYILAGVIGLISSVFVATTKYSPDAPTWFAIAFGVVVGLTGVWLLFLGIWFALAKPDFIRSLEPQERGPDHSD